MKLRRILGVLTTLCLLACLWTPAAATDNDTELEQAIIDACTYSRTVELSEYHLPSSELENIFWQLYDGGKLPWYTTEEYQYSYMDDLVQTVASFTPITLYEGNLDMAAYEETVAQILEGCVLPGMSQWQIALSLHDYLIANASYDESEEKNSGYDILVNRSAMCAGYAAAYQDLLQRAGVDCLQVSSEKMEHAWNLVCIDGSWYHVDLTWDDPTPDAAGFVSHEYFLLTDEEISAGEDPHYDWDTDISCTDTRFSAGFWRDVYGQICYESKDTCYLLRSEELVNSVYRRDENTGKETRLYKETTRSVDIGHGSYRYEHTGLSLRGSRLWFNSLDKLHSMLPDGTDLRTEYTHTGNTYLHGSHVAGNQISLTLMDHEASGTLLQLDAAPTSEHTHSFTRTVTPPSCTEDGFTLSRCDCGLEATGTIKEALGHNYTVSTVEHASLFAEGSCIYLCSQCSHTFTESTPKITLLDFVIDNVRLLLVLATVLFLVVRTITKKKKEKYHSY